MAAPWCAASISSSATRSRARRRKAASSPRKRRSTCRTSRSPIRRTARRPRSDSNTWARATTARKCGSPSVPESRSMADKDKDDKAEKKPQRLSPDQAAKAEAKAEKRAAAAKGKAAADGKADKAEKKPREAEPRVPARLKVEFDEAIRDKLKEQFGYKNRFEVPALDKIVINMGVGEGVADRKKVDNAAADLGLISGQK